MKKLFTLIGTVLLSVGVNAQTTLKVESFRMGIGEQKTITLDLNNSDFADAAAFCCDIVLPDGVEIAANEEGTYQFSVSDKDSRSTSSDLVIASAEQSDGAVRVVCFPKDASAFAGTSGAILNIPLVASEDLTKGTVEVSIASQEITNTTGLSAVKPEASSADLTTFIRSDANDDGKINITDVTTIASYLLGDVPEAFFEDSADANKDGKINITDVTTVAGKLLE
jgi:hypothetical protein